MSERSSPAVAVAEPASPAGAPGRYFQALQAAFHAAAPGAGGVIERRLAVGPLRIALRFAGDEIAQLMLPAFARVLPAAAGGYDATVCVFDSASTGVRVPAFTWRRRDLGPRGEVEGYNDERFRTIYHGDAFAPDEGFEALSMYDAATRTAIFWVAHPDRIQWWERSEPLRPSLHWALGGKRSFLAHGAVVGERHGAALLAARGGSGKTTTALACLEAGMEFLGDNYVMVSLDGAPAAHGIYGNAKVRPETLAHLPEIAHRVRGLDVGEGEKLIVDVATSYPGQLASSLPLRALVVPCLTGEAETRLVPGTPVEALLGLAPSTISHVPGNGSALAQMADLARAVPTYRLELGTDPAAGARTIRRLLGGDAT